MNIQDIHDAIADAVNMQELVQELGIPYKIIGANMCIICPKHNDRSFGSCIVFEKNIFCFACSESLNAIDLVMETNGCNFMDAVKYLSDFYGLHLDFKRDEERIDPLMIPKKVFEAADINDTAAFKKLYEENPNAAMQLISCCVFDAKKKYSAIDTASMPDTATEILKQRIAALTKAQSDLPRWRKEAGSRPLRIK